MSHNAAGLPPHIVSFTPSVLQHPGSATIAITGARLSTTCELELPAAFGTIISGPVLSNFSTTTVTATWTVNILDATDVTYTCTVSNGGLAASGIAIEIFHGFDPSNLLDGNGQYYDSTDTANANPHTATKQWDPTVDWNDPAAAGFTWSGAHVPVATTMSGSTKQAFFMDYLSSYRNTFGSPTNTPGGPWTIGFVCEIPAALLNGGSPYSFLIRQYTSEFAVGVLAYGDGRVLMRGGSLSRDGNGVGHWADAAGKFTVIVTHDGPPSGTWTTTMYVNAAAYGTQTGGGYYGNGENTMQIRAYDVPPGGAGMKFGDMFFKAGCLTPAEITSLHDFWANKFGF